MSGEAMWWLQQAVSTVLSSALVLGAASVLHRALRITHAARGYWLGAWALALATTPLAALCASLAPGALGDSLVDLPALEAIGDAFVATESIATLSAGPVPWGAVLALLYVTGVALVLVRLTLGLIAVQRIMRSAQPLRFDPPMSAALASVLESLRRERIAVGVTDARVSPFAVSWSRRRIVLPRALLDRLDAPRLALVLRHEAAHLARHDPAIALLMRVVGALFWFDPLLRVLARRVQLAAELACDAAALGAARNMRRVYAETYLETLRMSMARTLPCPAIAFSPQDMRSHRMRIAHIVEGDRRARKRPLLRVALALAAVTGGGGLVAVQAATAPAAEDGTVAFAGPIIDGRISSHFGSVRPAISKRAHNGVDLVAARGTPVHAPAAGVVRMAAVRHPENPDYGSVIVLDHGGGWQTVYAHLDAMDVAEGERVEHGQRIGSVGTTGKTTGPHVHVELHRDGVRVDPASVIERLVPAR